MIKSKLSLFCFVLGILIITACATTDTKKTETDNIVHLDTETSDEKITRKQPKPITVQETENKQEEAFRELMSDIEITVHSAPKPTNAGKPFSTPFSVMVKNSSGPAVDFAMTVSWPEDKNNGAIVYSSAQIKTNSDGIAAFLPATPQNAVYDKLTFYPTPVSTSPKIVQAAYNESKTIPYIVKTKYISQQGMLYAYDFNESGTPTTNSFLLLQQLRNAGMNVGNSPLSSAAFFDKPVSELYKTVYGITGKDFKFLISASFKYEKPVIEEENTVTVYMTADIKCINMADGSVILEKKISDQAMEKNKYNAEQKCRKSLAEKAAKEIIYGM